MKIVLFDLETGGVEPTHPNIQIAAVAGKITPDVGWLERDWFEAKIRFNEDDADPAALKMNHYLRATWEAEAVTEGDALRRFIAFCREYSDLRLMSKKGNPYTVAQLGGHNVQSFDVPRLLDMGKRHGDPFLACCWWYPLDTYQGAVWHFARHGLETPANYQLPTLAKHFGIEASGAHDALADVRMNGEILARLLHDG